MVHPPRPFLFHASASSGEYIRVTAQEAGWDLLHFAARRMARGESWVHHTGDSEWVLVFLGGVGAVRSPREEWGEIGRRPGVFHGMPYALYLPRQTEFRLQALSDSLEVAYGWCRADSDHPAALITPPKVRVELRGGGNATRQINHVIPPGFERDRLVVVEVYTPSGNWSSYPPHKHDEHRLDSAGQLVEADLEEVYFYKIHPTRGYALQRIYTGDGRLDELLLVRDNDTVLVPEGYHPVVSAPGYTTYYLNFLAGSAPSLAFSEDPDHAWVKETWTVKDPRLPLVSLEMERSGPHAAS